MAKPEKVPYTKGMKIEVSKLEDNSVVAWLPAVVGKTFWKNNLLVEYTASKSYGTALPEEIVDVKHVRPCPPQASTISFCINDEVEAFQGGGWCLGVIADVRPELKYTFKSAHSGAEVQLSQKLLRPRYDWVYFPSKQESQNAFNAKFTQGVVSSNYKGFGGAWFKAAGSKDTAAPRGEKQPKNPSFARKGTAPESGSPTRSFSIKKRKTRADGPPDPVPSLTKKHKSPKLRPSEENKHHELSSKGIYPDIDESCRLRDVPRLNDQAEPAPQPEPTPAPAQRRKAILKMSLPMNQPTAAPDAVVLPPTRGSDAQKNEAVHNTLHCVDEIEIEEVEENSSNNEEEIEDETNRISPCQTLKRGRELRSSSNGDSEGGGNEQEQAPNFVFTQGPSSSHMTRTYMPNVVMRAPAAPPNRRRIDYKSSGMTEEARKQRVKDPRRVPRDQVDYRFHTSFHQDFYESAILKKDFSIARSQYVDWNHLANLKDLVIDEVIRECRHKHVYKIMGYQHNWNKEVIAQFYATCFFEENEDVRRVHWMTEGTWYKNSLKHFSRMFGFDERDDERVKIHLDNTMGKKDMEFMYLSKELEYYGTTKNIIPFYGYLNRLFRKTLAPREGDSSNVSLYGRNVLSSMSSPSPPFSVFDYIWEEIKNIASSPHKCCGYAPYLMYMIEETTLLRFDYDFEHRPFHLKNDIPGPTLQVLNNSIHDPEARAAPSAPEGAPRAATRPMAASTTSRCRGASAQQERHKPPSPIREMFNFFCGMCNTIDLRSHKERQRRKKGTLRLKKLQERFTPEDPPSAIGSEGQESEPETMAQKWESAQQADYYSQFFPTHMPRTPSFGDMHRGSGSFFADPFLGSEAAPNVPPYDP